MDETLEAAIEKGSNLVSKYGWGGALDYASRLRRMTRGVERKFWLLVYDSVRDVMPESEVYQ